MNEVEKVLAAMEQAGKPLAAKEVAELTGLEKAIVDKVFTKLKKEEKIISPIRCKWEVKK